jgi:hypothetical protein
MLLYQLLPRLCQMIQCITQSVACWSCSLAHHVMCSLEVRRLQAACMLWLECYCRSSSKAVHVLPFAEDCASIPHAWMCMSIVCYCTVHATQVSGVVGSTMLARQAARQRLMAQSVYLMCPAWMCLLCYSSYAQHGSSSVHQSPLVAFAQRGWALGLQQLLCICTRLGQLPA